jgi:hypothetical protein
LLNGWVASGAYVYGRKTLAYIPLLYWAFRSLPKYKVYGLEVTAFVGVCPSYGSIEISE